MPMKTDDLRIENLRPFLPPNILLEELPLSQNAAKLIIDKRKIISRILHGDDDRLLVVVGPCSIHDPKAALDYAKLLAAHTEEFQDELLVVMRAYFEKPRTVVGWKGLINDPYLDETFEINCGMRLARKFLLDVAGLGLPAGTEFLDTITPQIIADIICWGAIGARTTESQVHRELASGLSMPVGFKNGTMGQIQIAVDAVRSAAFPHRFPSVTKDSVAAIVATAGNSDCHIILRGGQHGTNFGASAIAEASDLLREANLPQKVMVDCSHANSRKDPVRQDHVARKIADQITAGSHSIMGVMMESFIKEGRQDLSDNLDYGLSITDPCMSWKRTQPLLTNFAKAVRTRRKQRNT